MTARHAPDRRDGPARAVWIDGRLCRGDEARVSVFDRGARDGGGLFETLRVAGGRPLHWERHLERMTVSAAELGFPVPPAPEDLRRGLEEVLEAAGLADAVARITVTRGVAGGRPTRSGSWIDVEPLAARLWKSATAIFSKRPFEPGPLGPHKTTSRLAYHLAREEARAARVAEAILVAPSGTVLEGSASNVFAVFRGRVLTPPLALGILPGVLRGWVLEACGRLGVEAREQILLPADLAAADELFLTNSVQTIVPLTALDGRAIAKQEVGARLRDHYTAEVLQPVSARG